MKEDHQQDFTEALPPEMSLRIFSELDISSLCCAALTCKQWNRLIEDNDHLWRNHCLTVLAVCHKEVSGDRQEGLSWKVCDFFFLSFRCREIVLVHGFTFLDSVLHLCTGFNTVEEYYAEMRTTSVASMLVQYSNQSKTVRQKHERKGLIQVLVELKYQKSFVKIKDLTFK